MSPGASTTVSPGVSTTVSPGGPTASSTSSVHTPFPIGPATASSSSTSTSASASASSTSSTSTLITVTSSSTSSTPSDMSTSTTTIDSPSVTGIVNPGDSRYTYYGCYNETTSLNQTGGRRALYGGSMEAVNTMTVSTCLNYCNIDGFAYAGLEYETECWCSAYLSVFAVKVPDSECNFGCKGNNSEICGGRLKLSVYQKNKAPVPNRAPRPTNVSTKLFIAGLAIAGLVLEML